MTAQGADEVTAQGADEVTAQGAGEVTAQGAGEVTARMNSPSHRPTQLSCSEILSDIQWFIRSSKGVFYKLRAFERSLSRNL